VKKSITAPQMGKPVYSAIKGQKSKPVSKQRRTLAKQIRTRAAKDSLAAFALAWRGQQFSEIKQLLDLYYHELSELQKIESKHESFVEILCKSTLTKEVGEGLRLAYQKKQKKHEVRLCEIFLNSIKSRDAAKIIEIADAVKFLKTFKESGDPKRREVLDWKDILDKHGVRWPIKILAHVLHWPKEHSADGFSQLRRLCRELKFPLAPTRQIRTPATASKS
jgi:hypothetical protein